MKNNYNKKIYKGVIIIKKYLNYFLVFIISLLLFIFLVPNLINTIKNDFNLNITFNILELINYILLDKKLILGILFLECLFILLFSKLSGNIPLVIMSLSNTKSGTFSFIFPFASAFLKALFTVKLISKLFCRLLIYPFIPFSIILL